MNINIYDSSVCIIGKSVFLITFTKWYFLLFLVECGIAFHNLVPSRGKKIRHLVWKLGYVVCQKVKNECNVNEYLLLMKTFSIDCLDNFY